MRVIAQIGNKMRSCKFCGELFLCRFRPLPINELKKVEADSDPLDADQVFYMPDVIDIAIELAFLFLWADETGIIADHTAPFADHPDLLVTDIALDVVIFSGVRVRNDRRFGHYRQNVLKPSGSDMRKIDNYPEGFTFLDDVAAERGQSVARRTARRENAAIACGIAPGTGESNYAYPKFAKHSQQFQVGAEWFNAFHGNKQRDLSGFTRIENVFATFANRETPGPFRFGVKSRNLIERHAQTHLQQVTIFDINRDAKNADVARFEVRQKIRRQHARAVPFFVQIHWHVEVKIDNSIRVELVDSLFHGFPASQCDGALEDTGYCVTAC